MKPALIRPIAVVIGAVFLGLVGFLVLASYGGNHCDQQPDVCDCFCCTTFHLRGYESCSMVGLLIGAVLGAAFGYYGSKILERYIHSSL